MSKEKSTCNRCAGSGNIPCPACGGSGKTKSIDEGYGKVTRIVSCAGCHGSGTRTCGACGGSGQK